MPTPAEELRQLLGEQIPIGGSDQDTLFTDEQILTLVASAGGDMEAAAAAGWRMKAAEFANLVDTAEGTSKRSMSDLHKNALAMTAYYENTGSAGGAAGRTRIRKIVRT